MSVRAHLVRLGTTGLEKLRIHVGPMIGLSSASPHGPDPFALREHRLAWLGSAIKHFKPVLVILDPLFRFLAVKDGNDYVEVTEATNSLIALARKRRVHLLFTHHAKKAKGSVADAALGSTAISGTVDTIILLRRGSDSVRTIESNQRQGGGDLDATMLTYDAASGRLSLGGTHQKALQALRLQRLLAYLTTVPSASMNQILAAVPGDTGQKKATLKETIDRGLVRRRGSGTSGHPYRYSLQRKEQREEKREKREKRERGEQTRDNTDTSNHSDSSDYADETDDTDDADPLGAGKMSSADKASSESSDFARHQGGHQAKTAKAAARSVRDRGTKHAGLNGARFLRFCREKQTATIDPASEAAADEYWAQRRAEHEADNPWPDEDDPGITYH
jgi:hypothetical protein